MPDVSQIWKVSANAFEKKLRKARNLLSPSELNEILCLLKNVSDEIHVFKNFINEIQTAYLSMSKPKTWLAA